MAKLTLSASISSANVNLDTYKFEDWTVYCDSSSGVPGRRKSGGTAKIGNAQLYGLGSFQDYSFDGGRSISYTGGTVYPTDTITHGLFNRLNFDSPGSIDFGLQVPVKATTTLQTAFAFVRVLGGTLRISAILDDGSVATKTDTTITAAGSGTAYGIVQIDFQASRDTRLWIRVELSASTDSSSRPAISVVGVKRAANAVTGESPRKQRLLRILSADAPSGITGGSISSGEAIGAPSISASIDAAGIASAGAIGAPGIGAQITGAGGVASSEAIGAPTIGAAITGGSIASGQAIGQPAVSAAIAGGSIASAEAVGSPLVGGILGVGGIATGEALGAPTVSAAIGAAGIPSGFAAGAPTLGAAIAGAGGIASGEGLGSPSIGSGIAAAGIPSGEAVGAPALSAAIGGAGGIASAEAIGAPVVASAGIFATGIPSGEAFGQPSIGASIGGAGGIVSGEGVGAPIVGEAPEPLPQVGGIGAGFEVDVGGRRRQRAQKRTAGAPEPQGERKPVQTVYRKPLLQRILEERYPKVKPRKERAQKRARTIELEAAALALEKPIAGGETQFQALARKWMQQRPYVPEALAGVPLSDLFAAQVAFRIRQQQLEDKALQMLAARRWQDEEDALIALLLA